MTLSAPNPITTSCVRLGKRNGKWREGVSTPQTLKQFQGQRTKKQDGELGASDRVDRPAKPGLSPPASQPLHWRAVSHSLSKPCTSDGRSAGPGRVGDGKAWQRPPQQHLHLQGQSRGGLVNKRLMLVSEETSDTSCHVLGLSQLSPSPMRAFATAQVKNSTKLIVYTWSFRRLRQGNS